LLLALFAVKISSQILGDPIVHFQFEDGIPATWENGIVSTNNIAQWEYRGSDTTPDNTICSQGSCGFGSLPIASLTQSNGFVIFDSNYWDDDDGMCGGGPSGPDPAPHTAWLTTESIDLSEYATLVLTFQQQFKHYSTTTTKVQISIDGGAWTDIHTNSEVFSPVVEWETINITTWAAGESDVRIRFLFTGAYYWWLLDDIVIYSPNPNDLMLEEPKYTYFEVAGQALDIFEDMPYDQYPQVMIPQFHFSGIGTNIGGNSQTLATLNVQVKKNGVNSVYNSTTNPVTIIPGASPLLSLSTAFTSPTDIADYFIYYNLAQLQTDDNALNNFDTLDYSITPYSYARDEGPMVDKFIPAAAYNGQPHQVGNIFEAQASGLEFHSISAALAEETTVGSEVFGIVYNLDLVTVMGTTNPYTVNAADINSVGEEKMITLDFPEPLILDNDSLYLVMVGNYGGDDLLRVARSGVAIEQVSLVKYPQVNGLFYLLKTPMVRMNIFSANANPGCIDPSAINFDVDADEDDGSCDFAGCTNPEALNYDEDANWDDGTCLVSGCTNPEADNYDPLATMDDGSCIISGCTNLVADNYDPQANLDDGSCIISGCTDPDADNFDDNANTDDGSCLYYGCTDAGADNFDPGANFDDGSCIYLGCTNPVADNYDPEANVDDGSCIISGCTDATADNFDPEANNDDGSCFYLGCMDQEADNYDPTATIDDGSCLYYGCTDVFANNYDSSANYDDGSCLYSVSTFAVNDAVGCVPFTVTVNNQTDVTPGSSCIIEFGEGGFSDQCLDEYEMTYAFAGTYTIMLTYVQGDDVTTDEVEITVYDNPETPLIAYTSTPEFNVWTMNFTNGSFEWWLDGGVLADVDTSSFYPAGENGVVNNGFYQLLYTDQNGCSSWSDTLLVLQPQFYVVQDSLCAPGIFSIINQTDVVEGAACELMVNDELMSCNEGENIITLTDVGDYLVNLQYELDGEVYGVTAQGVTVLPSPNAPQLFYDFYYIWCEGCEGYAIEWFDENDVLVQTGDTLFEEPEIDVLYYVVVTNELGCSAMSSELSVPWSVSENDVSNSMLVYPNPAWGKVVVQCDLVMDELKIYDALGRCVLASSPQNKNAVVDVGGLAEGVYHVVTRGNGNVVSMEVVVMK